MRTASIALMFAAAAVALAQGPRGRQNQSNGVCVQMTAVQTVQGTVSAVNIAYGAQYPSIEVNKVLIKVAPVWFLAENDFEIRVGDVVAVTAAPCAADSYLHALEISNITTGASITLRDASGVPLWSGKGAGRQSARAAGGGCADPASVQTASGTVDRIVYGAGIQMPSLTLRTSDGALITMKIGPERVLLANDFELKPGDPVNAKFVHLTCTDEFAALELTANGLTVVLRTPDGRPAWQ